MRTIRLEPVSRIEGHAKVTVFVDRNGFIERVFFQASEIRGYEKLLTGLQIKEAPRIVSTICGICRAVHFISALKACDQVYGVEPTELSENIRKIVLYANIVEDHTASLLLLALPDIINANDVLSSFQKIGLQNIKSMLERRREAVNIIERLGGRFLHPVAGVPGGWARKPDRSDMEKIEKSAEKVLSLGVDVYELLASLIDIENSEKFEHPSDLFYISLSDDGAEFYDGSVCVFDSKSSKVVEFKTNEVDSFIDESFRDYSYSKEASVLLREKKIDVVAGVLSRFHAGFRKYDMSYEIFRDIKKLYDPEHFIPLLSYLIRALEIVYSAENIIEILRCINLSDPIVNEDYRMQRSGIGIVEAPRGLLIHKYETDSHGNIKKVRIITPTQFNINALNIFLNSTYVGKKAFKGVERQIENLIRTFDPCIACSTHSIGGKSDLRIELVRK